MSAGTADEMDELVGRIRAAYAGGLIADALALLDRADPLAVDEPGRLRLARLRAVVLIRSARYAEALEAIEGVAQRWIELGDLAAAINVSSLEAYIANQLGRLGDALDLAATTLVMLDDLEVESSQGAAASDGASSGGSIDSPELMIATCRNTLGLLFLDLDALDRAIAEFTRAFERAGHDPLLAGLVQLNLASALLRAALRNRDGAADLAGVAPELAAAERLAREVLDSDVPPRRHVEAASILASVLHSTHRHQEATEILEAHAHLEPLVDDYRAIADWHLLWARSHRTSGAFEASHERVEQALALSRRSGDLGLASMALRERSRLHEVSGDLASALRDLKLAEDESRSMRTARSDALVEQLLRRASLEASRLRLEREAERFGAERLRLVEASETDPLTGAGNRRRLAAMLAAVAEGPVTPVSVVMLDVDNFKQVNDRRGHRFGDSVLVGVASTLSSIAREGDELCRPGGDEFVLVLPGVTLDVAVQIAQRLRAGVRRLRWDAHGDPLGEIDPSSEEGFGVSVSIGVASGSNVSVDDLLELADGGLLEAKRSGRDVIGVMRSSGAELIDRSDV